MKLHYYPETDSLSIELNAAASAETREIADGVNVDIGSDGSVVGFDIDGASRKLFLSTLETTRSPSAPPKRRSRFGGLSRNTRDR